MIHGTIKRFNEDRGFGFIKRDDLQPDSFFHVSRLQPGQFFREGDRVVFDLAVNKTSGKQEAIKMELIDD